MARQTNRPRRSATPMKIRVLRLAGWRYSNTRGAWVHRAFRGRVGPVFIDPLYYHHPGVTDEIMFDHPGVTDEIMFDHPGVTDEIMFDAVIPLPSNPVITPIAERAELPRRPTPVPTPEPEARPAPPTRVRVRLGETEEPRVVKVDGRPPRRGVDPSELRTVPNVVPIKSARATG